MELRAALAGIAWNCVPLWQDIGPGLSARRLEMIAVASPECHARQILRVVPERIQIMLAGIPAAAAAGDEGLANLLAAGEPDRSRSSLTGLVERLPMIDRALLH